MASFTLPSLETQDISTGTFYAHIVDTIPGDSTISVSQLDVSDAIGYAPVELTGMTYSNIKWDFDDITFPSFYFNTIPVGVCICKRLGLANSSSDPVLIFLDFVNVLKQPLLLTTGRYSIELGLPETGVVRFNQYYKYTSGAYVNNEPVPKGLIYMLGTRNETQSYLNPTGNTINEVQGFAVSSFNRDVNDFVPFLSSLALYNFGSRRINVGVFGFEHRDNSPGVTFTIWGSNTYQLGDNVNDNTPWTALGSKTGAVIGWNFITCTDSNYWKFIRIVSSTGSTIREIEFYNSSMYSTHENLMSTVIDSPFTNDLLDRSGFGYTWTVNGAASISENSLLLNGGYLTTPGTSLANLTDRNFEFSIDYKFITGTILSNVLGYSIFNLDGTDYPFNYMIYQNQYKMRFGTSSNWFYDLIVGVPTGTKFDTIKTTRYGNSWTTTYNNTTQDTITDVVGGSVGSSGTIMIGRNNTESLSGYYKNLRLVT